MSRKALKLESNPLFSGPTLEARTRAGNPYRDLPIGEIDVDPNQPRRLFDTEGLKELSDSIKTHGIISPILVKPLEGGSYRLVAGERRLRAAKLAGLSSIPAILDLSQDELNVLPKQLVENLQRKDLSLMERAIAIGQLKEQHSLSVREIAERIGVSKSFVQRSLEVLSLPDDLKEAIVDGYPESKVLLLARVVDNKIRKQLLTRLNEISREQLEVEILQLSGVAIKSKKSILSHRGTKGNQVSGEDKRLIQDLQETLRTRVSIVRTKKSNDKGKLVIDFYSNEDLNHFVGMLLS